MPALIDLRRRIKSVRNTQQITQAMKSVATAKFKKAQRTVFETRPYWHNQPELMDAVASWAFRGIHPLLEKRVEKKILGIIITSDKGMCGAFNSNLLEKAQQLFEEKTQSASVKMILIGKKAVMFFNKLNYSIEREYIDNLSSFSEEELDDLSRLIMRQYILNQIDAVYVVYNEFKSILAPEIAAVKVLPVEFKENTPAKKSGEQEAKAVTKTEPEWEPGVALFLNSLLPHFMENQIRHFLSESAAAEYAARMMAMDNATKNAEELISDLTLVMNKIRQASITKELLEIMSAVEALAKK